MVAHLADIEMIQIDVVSRAVGACSLAMRTTTLGHRDLNDDRDTQQAFKLCEQKS